MHIYAYNTFKIIYKTKAFLAGDPYYIAVLLIPLGCYQHQAARPPLLAALFCLFEVNRV